MIPKVSVILPVYNAQSYLRESIDSILAQSFEDFELIIVNDGSTDDSLEIVSSYTDKRITLINQENAGLPVSLNRAIRVAKGQYLARQDADDVSLPSRLEEQVAYLDAHPQCALLGTWADILVENTPTDRRLHHPHLNGDIQIKLLFFNCFVHSSVMIRKIALEKSGLYPEDPEKFPPEDYDLWLRIAKYFEVANLPKPLLQYRELPSSISRSKLQIMQDRAELMSFHALKSILGSSFEDEDIKSLIKAMTHQAISLSANKKNTHHLMLEIIRDCKLQPFPKESGEIKVSFEQCQKLLAFAYQKSAAQKFSGYLPFNIIPLLKIIKNRWIN